MIIVLFHALYLFGKYVYENLYNHKEKTEETMVATQLLNVSEADYRDLTEAENFTDNNVKIKFFPPVYVQRYNSVQSVIASAQYHGKIQKVVDFGCAELSFAIHLKNTDGIQEIYCIDIDRPLLENFQTKVAPLHCDYLSLRTEPLTIHVCEGSIAHSDNKLANTDAVTCIELIEHLYPDDLDAFPYNVFGFIKPQVAIVTTPNADFNVLFKLNGFRHADHKFEWTRAQFQDWASNIVSRYPDYEVSFHGIGAGPGGTEHLGFCSQMAVFHRHTQLHVERPEGVDGLLKTIVSHKYPHRPDNRSDEEKMLAEAEYYIRLFSSRDEEYSEEIPLKKLMFTVEKFHISVEILKSILAEANWAIAERENGPVVLVPPQSTFSLNSDTEFDDFLDNDYRQHGGEDDWDALEPGAPQSGYFFDSYMDRDPQNQEEEENWDNEIPDTRHSSSSNLNSQNMPNSELHGSENPDPTSDSQWTMEDLINDDPLSNDLQQQTSLATNSLDTETELPSNSFLIGLDSADINYLDISNDTIDSSEHNLSSTLSLSHLSETSHSLGSNSGQSLSTNKNSTSPHDHLEGSPQSGISNTNKSSKGSQIPRLEGRTDLSTNPASNSMQSKLHSEGSLSLSPESAAIDYVDCNSSRNEKSSISTVEATFLLSNEQSPLAINKDPLSNAQELLQSNEPLHTGRGGLKTSADSVAQGCSKSLLLAEQSASENNDCHDLCSIYLQPSSSSDSSFQPKNEISHSSIKDLSIATNESCKNLDPSGDSVGSSYQKCETDLINTQKNESEGIKSQDSISFKSISDSSLDLLPKYTSSPQSATDVHRVQTQSESKTRFLNEPNLHYQESSTPETFPQTVPNYEDTHRSNMKKGIRESLGVQSVYKKIKLLHTNVSSLEGNNMDQKTTIPNLQESKTVESISPSPSQLSLQSNSDVSLSAATSTGSSNVDKWYAAETNPMYQRDFVVLKGGNDTADNPNEETASDSDATVSGSDKSKDIEVAEVVNRTFKTSDPCYKFVKSNQAQDSLSKNTTDDIGETELGLTDKKMKVIQDTDNIIDEDVDMYQVFPEQVQNSNRLSSFMLAVQRTDDDISKLSFDCPDSSNDLRPSSFSKDTGNKDLPTFDIPGKRSSERIQLQSSVSSCKLTPSNEVLTSYNLSKASKERGQLKYEFESVESKPFSPESLDTPPNSWSPEIMDSGYPNSASVHDITPEYELSSIANDRISDSDSASVGEAPVQGFYEFVEVENGDLANNNRDGEGNNVIAFEPNDLDDLQPLIDELENDMENENDIYVLQNGFPLWLLRILEMANPIDLEGLGGPQAQLYPAPLEQAGGDAPNVNAENDEGFDSSSSDDDTDIEDDEADEADDATTISSDETEDHSAENLRRDWRAGGDP